MKVSKLTPPHLRFRKITDNMLKSKIDKSELISETSIILTNYLKQKQIHARLIHSDFSKDNSNFNESYFDILYQLDGEFNIDTNLSDLIPILIEQMHEFEQAYNEEYCLTFPLLRFNTETPTITSECIKRYQEYQ